MENNSISNRIVNGIKIFFGVFTIIFQLGLFIYATIYFNDMAQYFSVIFRVLAIIVAIKIIVSPGSTGDKLSWVFFILVLPSTGLILYLVFGGTRLGKSLNAKIQKTRNNSKQYLVQDPAVLDKITDDTIKSEINLISKISGYPVYENTEVEYLRLGEIYFEKLMEEIEKAEKFIFLEYFIVSEGQMHRRLLDALIEKAKNGVDVRYIYDEGGSTGIVPKTFAKECREAGIKLLPFNPISRHLYAYASYRSHRKITVIDGNVGFTGGINIGDEYINVASKLGHWKDMGICLKGDGVFSLTVMFLDGWNVVSDTFTDANDFRPTIKVSNDKTFIAPFDDAPLDNSNPASDNYKKLITSATDYLYITTPYLIIDQEMVSALTQAAKSNVDVRIITPHVPDKKVIFQSTRAHYKDLLINGIRIFEYEPGFVHGKVLVSDDKISFVGSINFDYRSLAWNYECGAYIYDENLAKEVKADMEDTLSKCIEITEEEFLKQPLPHRMFQAGLRLISPLL